MPISVLILTLNEEQNLHGCLQSVAWSDDVLVLDSYSTDRTIAVAREYGARVLQRQFDNFACQRNYGLEKGGLQHEWVLHLDADERVTPALRDELHAVIQETDKDAFRVPSKMMFQGQWLRYSGMYPSYQMRFGRRGTLLFQQVGHGQRGTVPGDRLGTLREPLLHESFSKGLADWFERHNRYSTDEARYTLEQRTGQAMDWNGLLQFRDGMRRRRALKTLSVHLPFRPFLRFCYMYFLKRGFLDGRPGFTYCLLLSIYEYMTLLKVQEHRKADSQARAYPERAPTVEEENIIG